MKRLALLLAVSVLALICSGCPGTGQDRYFEEAKHGTVGTPGAAAQGTPSDASPASRQLSAQANGGSNLPASMPYIAQDAPAASQNLNAAPFLTTAGAPLPARSAPLLGLTSRADGTMFGPGDQPAAGIGPGMTPAMPGRQGGKTPPHQ